MEFGGLTVGIMTASNIGAHSCASGEKMLEQIEQRFKVTIRPMAEMTKSYDVSYQVAQNKNGRGREVSLRKARVGRHGNEIAITWSKRPAPSNGLPDEFEEDLRRRMRLMFDWLDLVAELIETVRVWANESDWSTRIVDKPMDDAEIGTYRAPALLLQHETTKALLEPMRGPCRDRRGWSIFTSCPASTTSRAFTTPTSSGVFSTRPATGPCGRARPGR